MPRKSKQAQEVTSATDIVRELLSVAKKERTSRELSVGIRNVSSETIGLQAQFGEEALLLHPTSSSYDDPNAVAVISFARWQAIRKSKIVGNGMIIRDDSILGDVDFKAPADKPGDVHPDQEKNLVLDPHAWITSRDEASLRADIGQMTSETSLLRLWAAVDAKVGELEKDVPREERRGKMSPGIKKAIQSLPMLYRLTEELIQARLEEVVPLDRTIPDRIRV